MDRQTVLQVLRQKLDSIPYNTLTHVVLFEERNGAPYISYQSSQLAEAVSLIVKNTRAIHDSQFDGAHGEFVSCAYVLDGDMELLVFFRRGLTTTEEQISEVRLRRRQPRLMGYKGVHIAVKIRNELRGLLPASADIIDADGDYTIVRPDVFPLTLDNVNVKFMELFREFQKHFSDNWVDGVKEKVRLVHLVPLEKAPQPSRTDKTLYLHKVYAKSPVAGYAEEIWEFHVSIAQVEGARTCLTVVRYNMNEQLEQNVRTTCGIDDKDVLKALGRDVLPLLGDF